MNFEISHKTHYRYSAAVAQSQHLVHLSPRRVPGQTVRHHGLIIDPAPAMRSDAVDAFGNPYAILDIELPHKEFVLHARSGIVTTAAPHRELSRTRAWDAPEPAFEAGAGLDLDVVQFRCVSRQTTATLDILDYAAASFPAGRPVMEGTFDLVMRIHRDFRFDPAATDVSTPIAEVFRQRRGVCQDFAHLSLACLRALQVPARYVSGYILTRPPPGQPRLQGADASHAWIAAWAPETGWVDFDPTNGMITSDEHIAIAWGRDYDDVSPISGVLLGGGAHTVSVAVDVVEAA